MSDVTKHNLVRIGEHAITVGLAWLLIIAIQDVDKIDLGTYTPLILTLSSTALEALKRYTI